MSKLISCISASKSCSNVPIGPYKQNFAVEQIKKRIVSRLEVCIGTYRF